MGRCTRTRLPSAQLWPQTTQAEDVAALMALGRSASSKMMCGALPPSSKVKRFSVAAPAASMALAVPALPVKLILSTCGWATR